MGYRSHFTKEELERWEKIFVKRYLWTKQLLEQHFPSFKRSIDHFNHWLFHFMQDHHINLKRLQGSGFKDWRAESANFLTMSGGIFIFVLGISSISGVFSLFLLILTFIFYATAIQIIETSRYSHEGEIPLSAIQDNTPNTYQTSTPKTTQKPRSNHLFGWISVICFALVSYIYFTDFEGLKDFCINKYTMTLLPESIMTPLTYFFKINPEIGYFFLILFWFIATAVICITMRTLLWIASKVSPEKHTREL